MKRIWRVIGGGSLAASALIGSHLAALTAQPRLSAMQGAWLQQGVPCGEVFAMSGKSLGFRKPGNMFAPAFIIAGTKISTPIASCHVMSVRPAGDRWALGLGCTSSTASGAVQALLSMSEDGALYRYFNDNDASGSRYRLCTPKDVSDNPANR